MRRPVDVKAHFDFLLSVSLLPLSQAASVAILALNERHLKRLLSEYVHYHHEDRMHLGLEKGTPGDRVRALQSLQVVSRR